MAQPLPEYLKKITSEVTPDTLNKQPITEDKSKLQLIKKFSSIISSAIESHVKSMSKSVYMSFKVKFEESKHEFIKYENKSNEVIDTANNILLNTLIDRIADLQIKMANETRDFKKKLEYKLLTPLQEYQKEISNSNENQRDFKILNIIKESIISLSSENFLSCIEPSKENIKLAKYQNDIKCFDEEVNEYNNSFEKKNKYEIEFNDASSANNKKHGRNKVSEETFIANCFEIYLNVLNEYHYNIRKILEKIIREVEELINNYQKKPIFGVSIEEYLRVSGSINQNGVSPVIRKLSESIIKKNGLKELGIFRIMCGSETKINRLIYEINSGYLEYIDFSDYHVHDLAGVITKYLRDLPDSILCNSLFDDWYNALNSSSQIEKVKNVLEKLPRVNYENLKYIVKLFLCVIENFNRNRVDAKRIGKSVGEFLLCSSKYSLHKNPMTASDLLIFLLSNYHELFPDDIDFSQFKPSESLNDSNTLSVKINQPINDDNNENNNTAVSRQTNNNVKSSKKQKKLSPETNEKNNNNSLPKEIIRE